MKIWRLWDRYGIIFLSLIILGFFAISTTEILKFSNIINILIQSSIVAIAGAGMTFAITTGGFDLSVGSVLALTTCVMGRLIPIYGVATTTLISIIVAMVIGFLNGIIITKLKIQTFVATLATLIIIQGIALIYTRGEFVPLFAYTETKVFSSGVILGIPVPIVMTVLVYGLLYMIYKFTPLGVYIRGIGSNESAARFSGIAVDRVIIIVFILTAVTASLSGIITVSQLLTGAAVYGGTFPLEVITVTILGGTSLSGGKGYLWGTLMASIMIGIIKSGLNLMGFSGWVQKFAIGLILLIALSIGGIRTIMAEKAANSGKAG